MPAPVIRALLALLLAAKPALADAPSSQVQLEVAIAIEHANAKQWDEALATLDRVIAAAPAWGEGYFLRAGVLVEMAGDASTLEALATPNTDADYPKMLAYLERAARDLETYLAREPEAANGEQVRAAIGALRARMTAVRTQIAARHNARRAERKAKAVRDDAAADAFARLAVLRDVTRRRAITFENHLASYESMDRETAYSSTLVLDAHWTYKRSVLLDVELPFAAVTNNDPDNGVVLGNAIVGLGLVRDMLLGDGHVRFGVTGTLGVGTTSRDVATELLAIDQGSVSPLRWITDQGFDVAGSLRVVRGGAFIQLEGAAGMLYPEDVELAHQRLAIGGGLKLSTHVSAVASFTLVAGDLGVPWLAAGRTAYELRLGIAGKRFGFSVGVPFEGREDRSRGLGISLVLTLPVKSPALAGPRPPAEDPAVAPPSAPEAAPDVEPDVVPEDVGIP